MRCPMGTASFALDVQACAGCGPSLPPVVDVIVIPAEAESAILWAGPRCLGGARPKVHSGDDGANTKISLDKMVLAH
jgi:hypothetical protein